MTRPLIQGILLCLPILCIPARAQNAGEWRNPKDGAIFVRIPAGELAAGKELYRFPDGFWLGRTEVTVGQFSRFVAETGYRTRAEKAGARQTWRRPGFAQSKHHPVVWLAFEDAVEYAHWAGADLPTEAEWQYAARAQANTKFYWGDKLDDQYLWHRENAPAGTQPVAHKLPNAWGLYDIVGNAWEYVRVTTADGQVCPDANGLLGASWTRCPRYKMRDSRLIDAIELSLGPVRTECPGPKKIADDNPWDDDRGLRCIRRIPRP
jgi:formylglycine-generating enzyme required for sulfatase activity